MLKMIGTKARLEKVIVENYAENGFKLTNGSAKNLLESSTFKWCTGKYKKEYIKSERCLNTLKKFYKEKDVIIYYTPNGVIWSFDRDILKTDLQRNIFDNMIKEKVLIYINN